MQIGADMMLPHVVEITTAAAGHVRLLRLRAFNILSGQARENSTRNFRFTLIYATHHRFRFADDRRRRAAPHAGVVPSPSPNRCHAPLAAIRASTPTIGHRLRLAHHHLRTVSRRLRLRRRRSLRRHRTPPPTSATACASFAEQASIRNDADEPHAIYAAQKKRSKLASRAGHAARHRLPPAAASHRAVARHCTMADDDFAGDDCCMPEETYVIKRRIESNMSYTFLAFLAAFIIFTLPVSHACYKASCEAIRHAR